MNPTYPIAETLEAARSQRLAYAKVTVLAYALWLVAYELVGHYAKTLQTLDLTSYWDRSIPLIPEAVWVYELAYLLPLVALPLIRDWHRVNVALLAAVLANASAFVVYLCLPVAFSRPSLGSSLAERMLAFEYAMDFSPGANNLPSMHVTLSLLVLFALLRQGLTAKRETVIVALVIAISAATVLVKQHLLIDVMAGAVWAFAAWTIAVRHYARRQGFDQPPLVALRRMWSF